jgi:hypothetical protein
MEDINKIETKKINYKGKIKEIPAHNTDSKLCENFIIAKMRYCKFEKFQNSEFCVYHTSNEEFAICPHDSTHKVLKENYNKHVKVCNILQEKVKITQNPWYEKALNAVGNDKRIQKELGEGADVNKLYEIK